MTPANKILFFLLLFAGYNCYGQQSFPAKAYKIARDTAYTTDTGYYQDHTIFCITNMVHHKKEGHQQFFRPNGELWKIYAFKNDSMTGPWMEYYEVEGKAKKYGFFKNNIPTGHWLEYYPSGKLKAEGNYIDKEIITSSTPDSLHHVKLCTLDANYHIKRVQKYDGSTIDSLREEFSITSSCLVLPFPLERYLKQGTWKYYNENKNLIKEENWDRGKLLGVKNW